MRNRLDIGRPERLNPWREMASLQRQMDRFFEESTQPMWGQNKMTGHPVDYIPSCDFEETDNAYLISVEVPGMDKNHLNVELLGNTLIISGVQQNEERKEGIGRTYERFHGRFERTFTLSHISETKNVEAHYKDGVLSIAVPKSEALQAKFRKITIGEGKGTFFGKLTGRTDEKKEREKAA